MINGISPPKWPWPPSSANQKEAQSTLKDLFDQPINDTDGQSLYEILTEEVLRHSDKQGIRADTGRKLIRDKLKQQLAEHSSGFLSQVLADSDLLAGHEIEGKTRNTLRRSKADGSIIRHNLFDIRLTDRIRAALRRAFTRAFKLPEGEDRKIARKKVTGARRALWQYTLQIRVDELLAGYISETTKDGLSQRIDNKEDKEDS